MRARLYEVVITTKQRRELVTSGEAESVNEMLNSFRAAKSTTGPPGVLRIETPQRTVMLAWSEIATIEVKPPL